MGTRAEAEDLLQEVFLKLYERPPTATDTNVSAWLYRVATNTGYNAIRNRQRQDQRDVWLVPSPDDAGAAGPEKETELREEKDRVRAALAHLRPEQAQLLLLRHMGLSYAELADICHLNPKSVGKLLSRAGDAFRQAYVNKAEG